MADEEEKAQKRESGSSFPLETSFSQRMPLPSDIAKRAAHSPSTSSSDLETSDSTSSRETISASSSPGEFLSYSTSPASQSSTHPSDDRLSSNQESANHIKPSYIKPSHIKPSHIKSSSISPSRIQSEQEVYTITSDYTPRNQRSLRVTIAEYCADLEVQLDLNIFQSDKSQIEPSPEKEISQKEYTRTSSKSLNPSPIKMPKRSSRSTFPSTFTSLQTQHLPIIREYSAGGLIFNSKDEVALIARRSRSGHLEWCLPKGHIESGETSEAAARREVYEETGILGDVIGSIATLDYWFTGDTEKVHKLVHHFILRQTAGVLSTEGDPDHEAEEARWVPFDQLTTTLNYPSERKIVWLYSRKYRKRRS